MILSRIAIFEASDAAALQRAGLLTPAENGKRKISRSFITSSANLESSLDDNFIPDVPSLLVPEYLESKDTLEMMGFSTEKAQELFSRYENAVMEIGQGHPHESILDFAKGYLDGCGVEDVGGNGDWEGTLEAIGISEELKRALLSEQYQSLLLTQTCKWWLHDTFKLVNESLVDLRVQSNKRAATKADPTSATASQIPMPEVPGFTRLYKGTTKVAANKPEDPVTKELDLAHILSFGPMDFHRYGISVYFATQWNVAKYYADSIPHRRDCLQKAIVQINFPNAVIARFQPYSLDVETSAGFAEWAELVYHCRRGERLPNNLGHLGDEGLIIGPMAPSPNIEYDRIKSSTEVTQVNLFRGRGRDDDEISSQHVFAGHPTVLEPLETACRDRVVIHMDSTSKSLIDVTRCGSRIPHGAHGARGLGMAGNSSVLQRGHCLFSGWSAAAVNTFKPSKREL